MSSLNKNYLQVSAVIFLILIDVDAIAFVKVPGVNMRRNSRNYSTDSLDAKRNSWDPGRRGSSGSSCGWDEPIWEDQKVNEKSNETKMASSRFSLIFCITGDGFRTSLTINVSPIVCFFLLLVKHFCFLVFDFIVTQVSNNQQLLTFPLKVKFIYNAFANQVV